MNKTLATIVLIFLVYSRGYTQTPKRYLINTGKIFNSVTGEFLKGQTIIINGNRIESIKKTTDVTSEEKNSSIFVDLSSYAVLPGLIDAHTHLLHNESLGKGSENDLLKEVIMYGDAYRAISGAAKAKGYLESGITSVQDLGNSGKFGDVALNKAIINGIVIGPRIKCSGPGLSSIGGQIPGLLSEYQNIISNEYRIIKGIDDGVQAVREHINQGAEVIKIYSNNSPNKTALSVEEISAITKEAHRYGIRVTAHATDDQSVLNAVLGGVDGIEHGYDISDSTLELMAKKGVILVPTDGDNKTLLHWGKLAYPEDSAKIEKNISMFRQRFIDRLKRAIKKGVMIAAGSDDYHDFKLPIAEPSKRIIIGYTEAGMTLQQALKSATFYGAKQINMEKQIGQLSTGFLADLIAVDASLDSDINAIMNVYFVMKDGKIYKNDIGEK